MGKKADQSYLMKMNLKVVLFNMNASFDITHNSDKVLFIYFISIWLLLNKVRKCFIFKQAEKRKMVKAW